MMIDLRQWGKPYILSADNVILRLEDIDKMIIKVQTLNAGFEIKFETRESMDEFISMFTGTRNNIPIVEVIK